MRPNIPARVLSIVQRIARERDVPVYDILGQTRTQVVCQARFAIWAALSAEGKSLTQIGNIFGRDHTSVLNGLRRHAALQPRLEAAE